MATNALTYIRNVGKSIGYASIDVLKEKNPVITNFMETNGSVISDTYKTIRSLKQSIRSLQNKEYLDTELGKFGKTYLDNLMSDIKTGKLYNKEREDEYETSAAASQMEGLDLSVFDDFGDGPSDMDDLDDEVSSNDMMDIVGERASNAVSMAMARSAEYIVQSNAQTTRAMQNQNQIIYAKMHNSMNVINENISSLLRFSNENVNMHIENSRNFYENITGLDKERNQYLKDILETVKEIKEPAKKDKKYDEYSYSNLVDSDGILDLEKYAKLVFKNINDMTGGTFEIIKDLFKDPTMLNTIIASPLQGIAQSIVKSVIPKTLDKSMESLNKSLSGVVGNIFASIKDKAFDSEIWEAISNIFGISTERRTSIDTRNYEKGKVPFDGITRKAIIEVIPTYLSKILSTLNGQERDTFDYDNGKFVKISSLKDYKDRLTKNSANSAASDLDRVVRSKVNNGNIKFQNKDQEEQFWKDWEQIKLHMYTNQMRGFDTRNKNLNAQSFLLDHSSDFTVKLLQTILDGTSENLGYANRMFRETNNQSRTLENMSDHSAMNAIENDSDRTDESTSKGISAILGQANSAIVDKLLDIHKELSYIRIYGIGGSGAGNIIGNGNNRPNFNNFTIPTSVTQEVVTEASAESKNNNDDAWRDLEGKALLDEINKVTSGAYNKKDETITDAEVSDKNSTNSLAKKKKKTLSEKMEALKKGALGIVQGPLNLASSVIDRVDARIYELFYGPIGGREEKDEDDDRTLSEILFDNLENQFEKFSDWMNEKIFDPLKFKSLKENAHDAAAKFLGIFGIDLDKTVEGIKDFLLGTDEDGNPTEGGIFGKFILDFKKTFSSIGKWIKGGFEDLGEETGVSSKKNEQGKIQELVNKGARVINKRSEKLKEEQNKNNNIDSANTNAEKTTRAFGITRIKKRELAVLSPGEMVIPASSNPFVNEENERKEQDYLKELGFNGIHKFGSGITDVSSADKSKTKKEQRIERETLNWIRKNIQGKSDEEVQAFLDEYAKKHPKAYAEKTKYIESHRDTLKREHYEEGRNPFLQRSIDNLINAINSVTQGVKDNLEIDEKDTENFKKNAWQFLGDIKDNGGTLAAGATIGGGVSLLTGLVGGPLVGAAAGASVALIQKSESVREALFGNEEEGKSGVLPKKVTEAIKKYAPGMGKAGALGGILSFLPIFPGGPITGMLVGSALGFAKNNEKVQETIFGEGKLFGDKEKFQDRVKSVLPKMGAGALVGLVAGPFGSVATNILLGSAIGFASDTDRFKNALFGEVNEETDKREGGIIGAITKPISHFFKEATSQFKEFMEKDIIDPIKKSIDPFKKQIELMGKGITNTIGNLFKNHVVVPLEKKLQKFILEPLGKAFNLLFNPIKKMVGTVISSPFKLIGKAGDALRRRQIKSGNADYMSAEERVAYRESKGWRMKFGDPRDDIYHKLDKSMVGKDSEALSAAESALSGIASAHRNTDELRQDAFKNISKALRPNAVNYDISRTVKKMVENGNYEGAIDFVNRSNIEDPKVKNKLLDTIKKESAKIQTSYDMKKDSKGTITSLGNALRDNLGFDLDDKTIERLSKNPKEAEKLLKYIKGQQDYISKNGVKENTEEKKTEEYRDDVTKGINKIADLLDQLVNGKTSEDGNAQSGGINPDSEVNQNRMKAYEEEYDEITDDNGEPKKLSLAERIKRRYRNKGKIVGTLGLAKDVALAPLKLTGKLAKGTLSTGFNVAKFGANEVLGMYDAMRDTTFFTKMWGNRYIDPTNPDKPKEIKTHESKILGLIGALAAKDGVDPTKIDTKGDQDTILGKIKNKFKQSKIYQFINGRPIVYAKDKDGNPYIDPSSEENRDTLNAIEAEEEQKKGLLDSIKSIPSFFKDLFGNKEKDKDKKSIFEKILDFFTGGNGLKISFGSILSSVLKTAIPAGLAYLGLSGKLDDIVSAITGKKFGDKGSNDAIYVTDSEGNKVQIKVDENGNPITDDNGNYITISGDTVSGDAYLNEHGSLVDMSLSDRLKYNIARGAVTGKGSIIGSMFKKTPVGKAVNKAGNNVKGIGNIIKNSVERGTMDDIIGKLMDNLDVFIKALKKVPLLGKYVNEEKLINLGVALGDLIERYLPKLGSKLGKAAASLSKLALPIAIITAIADFSTGWQDASNILKIKAEHVTTPQKIICGLVRTFKNLIPIVGTFIPDQVITDLFINHVAKWFNIDISQIKKQQDEAQAELDEYNAANPGAELSWSEYNKMVNGEYTWTEKIGNGFSSFVTNVKEKGFGNAVGSAIKNSNPSKWISEKVEGIKDGISNLTKPVFDAIGERLAPIKDVGSYAIKVVKDTWKEILTGKEIESDLSIDPEDPNASLKRVIYNIVKILTHNISGVTKMGRSLWEKLQTLVDGVKTIGKGIGTSVSTLFSKAWEGDIIGAFTDKSGDTQTGNAFIDNTSKFLNSTIKASLAVPGLLTSAVGSVVDKVSGIINAFKAVGTSVKDTASSIMSTAMSGENPLGKILSTDTNANTGFTLVDNVSALVNGVIKIPLTPIAMMVARFNRVKNSLSDTFSTLIEADKLSEADQSILDKANEGEISVFSKEYWKVNTNLTGLAGGFNTFKSYVEKILNLPTALIATINPLKAVERGTSWIAEKLGIDDSETKPKEEKESKSENSSGRRRAGKGSGVPSNSSFISQVDPRYSNQKFNIAGDSKVQTIGDTGCAPAAAAMAVNATYGSQQANMSDASKLALKYKVRDDGVSASYFNDEFARHGLQAKYIMNSDVNARSNEIMKQLMNSNKVVLMGQDSSNMSKAASPFGPNPHYVVATGLSEDGKFIYINDPESNRPNLRYSTDKILGTSKLGISANAAMGSGIIKKAISKFTGRGSTTDTIKSRVWSRLRSAGFSEVQVAGIMGNIEHESRFDPSVVEKGAGVGFGLVQWSHGRRTQIESYAASIGKSANDLDTQIDFLIAEMTPGGGANGYAKYQFMKSQDKYDGTRWPKDSFLNAKTIEDATKAFCFCFERPKTGKSINKRIEAAKKYFEMFTGKQISVDYSNTNTGIAATAGIGGIASTVANNNVTTEDNTSSSNSSMGPMSGILSAINKIAEKYGFKTSSYEDTTTTSTTNTGEVVHGGDGVRRTSGTTNIANGNTSRNSTHAEQQKALVNAMYQLEGSLKYAQNNSKYPGSRNPEVLNPDGTYSGDCSSTIQYVYKKVLGVDPGSWTGAQAKNKNTYTVATSTKDESVLQLGDLLLKDGHVEMYAGNNTMIGHGGGKKGKVKGPTVKELDKSGKYNLVRRWIGFKGSGSGLFGRGSDEHPEIPNHNKALQYINPDEFTSVLPFGLNNVETVEQTKPPKLTYDKPEKLSNVDVKVVNNKPVNGRAAQVKTENESNDMIKLVKSIVDLLVKIVTNTDHLGTLVRLTTEYITALETAKVEKTQESKETAVLAKQNLINAMQNASSSNEPNAQLMRLIEQTERVARE